MSDSLCSDYDYRRCRLRILYIEALKHIFTVIRSIACTSIQKTCMNRLAVRSSGPKAGACRVCCVVV